jgi:hypothetical protein
LEALFKAIRSETIKVKRTLALWSALIIPAAILLLYFVLYSRPSGADLLRGRNAWLWMTQNALILWSMIMLPLFVAMETALLASIEHRSDAWKHLFVLPTPRWSIYIAKLVMSTALVGLAMLSMMGWIFMAGKGIEIFNPGIGFEEQLPLVQISLLLGTVYLASWFIIAIHTWIALRWHNFVVPVAVGTVSIFFVLIVSQSQLWWLFPWALAANVENTLFAWLAGEVSQPVSLAWTAMGISLVGFMVAGLLGCWEVTQRDVL